MAATDPEIAALRDDSEQQRRRDIEAIVDLLLEAGPLRVPRDEAVDLVFALTRSTDLHRTLTLDLGWSDDRAFGATKDTVSRMLFPDA